MDWKKKLLSGSKLYLILDAQVNDYKQLLRIADEAVCSGVGLLQVRDKYGVAKDAMNFTQALIKSIGSRVPVIVNDRVDISQASLASGVHLGQDDKPLSYARKVLGSEKIIGKSCQTMAQARIAQEEGADYIGFGSVFKTLTKPDREPMDLDKLQAVVSEIKIPVFAIGGITLADIGLLQGRGVTHFAVCRAICTADNVVEVAKSFKDLINHDSHTHVECN